jgi:hypothetical protein
LKKIDFFVFEEEEMKKFLLAMCLAAAVLMMVTPAVAEELWDFHLRGVDEGLAAGALPPPGFYFINDVYFANFKGYGVAGPNGTWNATEANSNVKLPALIDVPILVWVPGCKLFGADYGAGIAQPFDFTNLRENLGGYTVPGTLNAWASGNQWGTYNTLLIPAILSWKVCDFRIKAAMDFGLNDGTTSPGNSIMAGPPGTAGYHIGGHQLLGRDGQIYAWSSNDSWQFTPNLGISWLHAGWNLSADFFYTWYTKDTDTQYQNGPEFAADYTISYTCGKWTFGLGAAQENQTSNDKFDAGDGTGYHSQPNSKYTNYSMGPLVGYNFGPCSLMFMYNFPLSTSNDVGGEWFNVRLVVPLGNPYPIGK